MVYGQGRSVDGNRNKFLVKESIDPKMTPQSPNDTCIRNKHAQLTQSSANNTKNHPFHLFVKEFLLIKSAQFQSIFGLKVCFLKHLHFVGWNSLFFYIKKFMRLAGSFIFLLSNTLQKKSSENRRCSGDADSFKFMYPSVFFVIKTVLLFLCQFYKEL